MSNPQRTINIYQIYDREAGCMASPLFTEYHDAIILREFYRALAEPKTRYGQSPTSYELRYIGYQFEETGIIHGDITEHRVVATGRQWLDAQERQAHRQPGDE